MKTPQNGMEAKDVGAGVAVEIVTIEGHIIDSLTLARVLDTIIDAGADYRIADFHIGRRAADTSQATIEVTAPTAAALESLLNELQVLGANRVGEIDAAVAHCQDSGVLPASFYVTTNLATELRWQGRWVEVEQPEMDCAIVVADGRAVTRPMHRVARGDLVVIGNKGIRVRPLSPTAARGTFEFMASEVSTEKPKAVQLNRLAERMRAAHARDQRILAVCGPALIHTGGASALARLVREGWIDLLFAGNGFATHDMESEVFGTSLGVSVTHGNPVENGHDNHLRLINEIRRFGSIRSAVEAGYVSGGVMYECVRRDVPFVLAGSIRDDGPLPDTITDTVLAVDMMREHVRSVGVALMLATTLHSIATGNLLPATVETFCVDINAAVVTKLADRGTHQSIGIVTDVGPFVADLAERLAAPD